MTPAEIDLRAAARARSCALPLSFSFASTTVQPVLLAGQVVRSSPAGAPPVPVGHDGGRGLWGSGRWRGGRRRAGRRRERPWPGSARRAAALGPGRLALWLLAVLHGRLDDRTGHLVLGGAGGYLDGVRGAGR